MAVKAGGDDPSINRQLAAVMSEGERIHELAAAPSFACVLPHLHECPFAHGAVHRGSQCAQRAKGRDHENIKRATDTNTANYDELTYEAYGHGGVGIIINCLSDNKNRAVEMVNTAIKKENCKIAASGSVAFNFERKGRLTINKELSEDEPRARHRGWL